LLPTKLVKLTALMQRTSGSPEVRIGLIDGPVFTQHADLVQGQLIGGRNGASCTQTDSGACLHGTFVASILAAKRTSSAPAICPNCTLLIRPIFSETTFGREHMPSATPQELATAIFDCINAGARVINLSLALAQPSTRGEQVLDEASQTTRANRQPTTSACPASLLMRKSGWAMPSNAPPPILG
jgi:hypothetical protein